MIGKLFAVVVILIALASAVPIVTHTFLGASVTPPEDISTHGAEIDEQMDETMVEAGFRFWPPKSCSAFFVWEFAGAKGNARRIFRAEPKYLVLAAVLLVGAEVIALGAIGSKAWAKVYFQASVRGCAADSSPGGTIRVLLPLCGSGWKIWRAASGKNRRRQFQFLRPRSGKRHSCPR